MHGEMEIRRRLDEVIPALQTALVLAPKRVTLPKNKSAKEYAALLGAQSHYVILADGIDAKRSLDLSCSQARSGKRSTGCAMPPAGDLR